MHGSRQLNCWSLRCSWSIACRRCSNYIFILNLTPGFNGLGKYNYKMRREAFKFWDCVQLILETVRYLYVKDCCSWCAARRQAWPYWLNPWFITPHLHFKGHTSWAYSFNTLKQNGHHFCRQHFQILLNENFYILLQMTWKVVSKGPIYNKLALFQILAWHWACNKPLSMMINDASLRFSEFGNQQKWDNTYLNLSNVSSYSYSISLKNLQWN